MYSTFGHWSSLIDQFYSYCVSLKSFDKYNLPELDPVRQRTRYSERWSMCSDVELPFVPNTDDTISG